MSNSTSAREAHPLVGCKIIDNGAVGGLVGRIVHVFADGSIRVSWNGSDQATDIRFARIKAGQFSVEVAA